MRIRLCLGIVAAMAVFGFHSAVATLCAASEPAPPTFRTTLTLHGLLGKPSQGVATFRLSTDGTRLDYRLEVHGVRDITMAHIHLGQPGKITTPVVWLYPPAPPPKRIPGVFDGLLAQGTITAQDLRGPLCGQPLSALIVRMKAGETFVNIHAKQSVAGEICGAIECLEP